MPPPTPAKLIPLLILVSQLYPFAGSLLLPPARNQQFAQQQGARYELKFQNELDNSTIIKRETQPQIFKCQVRLAPFAGPSNAVRARFKTRSSLSDIGERNTDLSNTNSALNQQQISPGWPANVTLSVDWFKGDQQLAEGSSLEPISVVSVELKSNGTSAKSGSFDRVKSRPRLEIKNTLNGGQLKLTSRLKLSHLKATDSGQYKCIARAQFQALGSEQSGNVVVAPAQLWPQKSDFGEAAPIGGRKQLWAIQQTLESKLANLIVTNSSATDEQLGMQSEINDGTQRKSNGDVLPNIQSSSSLPNELNRERNLRLANDRGHATPFEQTPRVRPQTDSPLPTATGSNPAPSIGRNADNDEYGARQQAHLEQTSNPVNQFEDDEDLFKTDPRIKFISGAQQQANDDDEEEQAERRQPASFTGGEPLSVADRAATTSGGEPEVLDWWEAGEAGELDKGRLAGSRPNQFGANKEDHQGGVFSLAPDGYLAGSFDSTRLRLAKFVHKIAPELSCYTGSGEHYRGNVSVSRDGRSCLNWSQTRRTRSKQEDHNNCRNPNLDRRGPWCYVRFDEQLDGAFPQDSGQSSIALLKGSNGEPKSSLQTQKPLSNPSGQLRYVRQVCPVSACSEYLWFYIVAPPLGFLILVTCFFTLLVRSMRKSHYNSIFSIESQRGNLPRFNKLLKQRGRFAPKKFGSSSAKKSSSGHYLDEDIFEINDDLDWSDGQVQSLSPKSTESLKLTSSFSSCSHETEPARIISTCKSTNPIFCDKPSQEATGGLLADLMGSGKQVTGQQVGPMFATLRCHIRGKQANLVGFTGGKANDKSSTFIEQCDLATSNRRQYDSGLQASAANKQNPSLLAGSSQSGISSISSQCKPLISVQSTQTTPINGHLISYSSSNSSKDLHDNEEQFNDCNEKFIIGSELPKLDASSVAIVLEQQQPLYEGKFSQIQLAYINEPTKQGDISSSGRIGAQVAVCSLKTSVQSNFDTDLFSASRLKLHNLNHLNLLKLIGYAQLEDEIGLKSSFTLIYDMAQLVDLSDWLKQQSKDTLTNCERGNEFGIRRNLTCLAKQIALAVDYLHDKEIIYKDLACRNCFLDPTKMLVKVASFNLEPIINSDDNNAQNLKSMIRPKYLLDYYVIDSRPSDCQLLPLSWIPLESILFNKFNKQTDVWSFGCLLYELFSLGEVAYFGYSSKQVIDAVRSNLMPPQPLLCPNGIHKLMCKCLSDIPTIRPNVKQIYEQLNLYGGQCSSFLDHHLCSLDAHLCNDHQQMVSSNALKSREHITAQQCKSSLTGLNNNNNSITKTKSYANIRNLNSPITNHAQDSKPAYHNLAAAETDLQSYRAEVAKLPLSKSINMGVSNRSMSSTSCLRNQQVLDGSSDNNHYDEPVLDMRKPTELR